MAVNLLSALAAYIPRDRVEHILHGAPLTDDGVALIADISGFTPLTEALTHGLSPDRGAEELTRALEGVFTPLIAQIHAFGGSVIKFGGDALIVWYPRPPRARRRAVVRRAITSAWRMQNAIRRHGQISTPIGTVILRMKVGLTCGPVKRFRLGDAELGFEDVLAGATLDRMAEAEHHAEPGDIVTDAATLNLLPPGVIAVKAWRGEFAALGALARPARSAPWPSLRLSAADEEALLPKLTPYVPAEIYRALAAGRTRVAELKPVVSLFVQFHGLDYDADPAVRDKLQTYFTTAQRIAHRYGGRLNRLLTGDKGSLLHIIFGAPRTVEEQESRAIRCALDLQAECGGLPFIIMQRIGVTEGRVFAGPVGSPHRYDYTTMGDSINLSARLMTAAEPNTILVDDYSQQRTVRRFEFDPLPPMRLKGKAEPVTAYRLRAERMIEVGLEARFLTSRWPLVGREKELAALKAVAGRARQGRGQIIALSGRLGVGKTRLIEEIVRDWLAHKGNGFLGQCSQHLRTNPYQAWNGFWHDFFRLSHQASAAEKRHRLQELTGYLAPDMLPWLDALGEVIGLPLPPDSPLLSLEPEDRRQKLYQLSLSLLLGRAQQHPLLILFEDLHWVDEASAALIDHIAARIEDAPVLLCLLFRSDDDAPVRALSLPHSTHLTLQDLSAPATQTLIQAMLGDVALPPDVARDIFDKTQGTPLYVEELVNSLRAAGALRRENGRYRLTDRGSLARIPDTLQDLIRARLDRLEPETRDLTQVAAVIDREFPFNILRDVYPYPMSGDEMRNRLDELVVEDITTLTEPEPLPSYAFKHALMYEVAYNSLAFARRQTLHRQIARSIEHRYADHLEEHFSSLAYHYRQANMLEQALHYSVEAGLRAQRLYANKTAMEYYQQAETYLQKLPLDRHHAEAIRLYLNRARLHRLKMDMAAAHADLDRALEIARAYDDTRSQAQVYNHKAEIAFYQEQAETIWREAQHALELARKRHPRQEAAALYHLGVSDMMSGHFDRSLRYLQQAYKLAQRNNYPALRSEALNKIATVQFFDGHLQWALQAYQQVYQTRHSLGLKDKEAETLSNIATLQFRLNRPAEALQTTRRAIQLAQEAGWQLLIPYVQLLQVELLTHMGDYVAAEAVIERTYPLFAPDDEVGHAYARLTHGREILLDLSRFDEAAALLSKSLTTLQKYNIYEEMARALTSLGTLYSRQKKWKQAGQYFSQAKAICLERRKGWYLSEIYARLAETLLHRNNLTGALEAVRLGLKAIQNRSNPDWHGPLLSLSADIARRQQRPPEDVTNLYLTAVRHVKQRGRAIIRNRILIHVGTQLLSHDDPTIRRKAEGLIQEGMAWLQARGEGMLQK